MTLVVIIELKSLHCNVYILPIINRKYVVLRLNLLLYSLDIFSTMLSSFCEAPAAEFAHPGNLTSATHEHLHRPTTSSSVSSSDDETVGSDGVSGTAVGGTGRRKKRGLLAKLTGH